MPHVVIAGAGPIGLYTAIRLKMSNPTIVVTVVDGRLGHFNRSGVIALGALNAIQRNISDFDVAECGSQPPAIYIRELQEKLSEYAIRQGVTLIPKDFATIEAGGAVQLAEKAAPTKRVALEPPCHLLIDCTGESRAIIQDTTPMATNPIPYHFIAYINMDKENSDRMKSGRRETPTLSEMALFRKETGWLEFEPPINPDTRYWEPTASSPATYCLYFEVPQTVAHGNITEQERYLKALLKLKKGVDIEFNYSDRRGEFNAFEVQPKKLINKLLTMGNVSVVSVGDSLISAEYRLGVGVENGVICADGLIAALEIHANRISIIERKWDSTISERLGWYENNVKYDYASKRRQLLSAAEEVYRQYQVDPLNREDLTAAADFKLLADKFMLVAAEKEEQKKSAIADYNKAAEMYKRYYAVIEDTTVKKSLIKLAGIFKRTGDGWLSDKSNADEYRAHYATAIDLYNRFNPESAWNEKCKIYSNSGKLNFSMPKPDYKKAIDHFKQSLQIAIDHDIDDMKNKIPESLFTVLKKLEEIFPDSAQAEKQEVCEILSTGKPCVYTLLLDFSKQEEFLKMKDRLLEASKRTSNAMKETLAERCEENVAATLENRTSHPKTTL